MIGSRSPIVRTGIRAATPLALVVGTYLLFAGHNNPGGGFAAGLVYGAVITLRTVAGMQRPTHATGVITAGIVAVAVVAIAPLIFGNELLDQEIVSATLPLLGKVKTGSALPFDIGVAAIVVGLVIALLDGLGATELDEASGPRRGAHQ